MDNLIINNCYFMDVNIENEVKENNCIEDSSHYMTLILVSKLLKTSIPITILINKMDGSMGFPTIKLNKEDFRLDKLKQTLKEEMKINFGFEILNDNNLKLNNSLYDFLENTYIHNFIYELEFYDLTKNFKQLQNQISLENIIDFKSNITGSFILLLEKENLSIISKQQMFFNSKELLTKLLGYLNINHN